MKSSSSYSRTPNAEPKSAILFYNGDSITYSNSAKYSGNTKLLSKTNHNLCLGSFSITL